MTSNQSHPQGYIQEQLHACLDGNRSHQLSNDSLKVQTTCCFQMTLLYTIKGSFKTGCLTSCFCSLYEEIDSNFTGISWATYCMINGYTLASVQYETPCAIHEFSISSHWAFSTLLCHIIVARCWCYNLIWKLVFVGVFMDTQTSESVADQ